MSRFIQRSLLAVIGLFLLNQCVSKKVPYKKYVTENVIVLVVDGPRFSETWGDQYHSFIPRMDTILSKQGVVNTSFYNLGETWTTAGHTAITTGVYESINNAGAELPSNPSIFQLFLKDKNWPKSLVWLVTSKDKLAILGNCSNNNWSNSFLPSMNCGVNGLGIGSGYRADSLTFEVLMDLLDNQHPRMLFVNFREPDYSGHQANWLAYIKGIRDTDEYVYQVWQKIQSDSFYKDKTTLFVTNDHGRHLDSVANGFVSHGDNCEGCRHIFLYAFGPDFKKNAVVSNSRNLTDIHATILELFHLKNNNSTGMVMTELFVD